MWVASSTLWDNKVRSSAKARQHTPRLSSLHPSFGLAPDGNVLQNTAEEDARETVTLTPAWIAKLDFINQYLLYMS